MFIDFKEICVSNGIIAEYGTLLHIYDNSEIRKATEQEKFEYYFVNF